jgi:hypothetical protein
MTRDEILKAMEDAMITLGHNAPWWARAIEAFYAISRQGAAVVDRHELELLKSVYGFSLPDLTEPQE